MRFHGEEGNGASSRKRRPFKVTRMRQIRHGLQRRFLLVFLVSVVASTPARAALTLTPYAMGPGRSFTLTTFASGFPVGGSNAGPFGVAYRTDGTVLVSHNNGSIY